MDLVYIWRNWTRITCQCKNGRRWTVLSPGAVRLVHPARRAPRGPCRPASITLGRKKSSSNETMNATAVPQWLDRPAPANHHGLLVLDALHSPARHSLFIDYISKLNPLTVYNGYIIQINVVLS